ncbi:GntR family transcriptional regulator [Blastococcus sp. TF02A-30]|uniref:GntR family transcriptional regulator n=1 Tax=Blastococcus sp. TF02A-30 TaxID=2250580 RepID=UPI000DE89925|nr:GntR family transcriptional regulator [Blastococcus sp. TF02A-30]RBY91090.1 GntR family transcriptional regulator [Blastococcus sp. TF02A-30]
MTRPTTSAERALHELRELILAAELAPGARLGEVELAERLGVSRTPVREALTRLAAEGLVEITPNRGARVATWTVAELEGVFDLRLSLEPQLTGFAVPNAGERDVAELDDLAHRMLAVGTPGPEQDLDALVPLNRVFHDRLVALAGHPTLAAALAAAIHPPIVRRNFHAYDPESLRRSLAHHLEMVAALRARDPGWARAVMTAHICNARAVMVRAATAQAARAATSPHPQEEEAS